ncbi:MAG TPA: prepilin-type N-terminal cleavage/methylation domain-containing protein, partial [Thermotogota bacterium]|nr:prepilin-type N-terminal cleavage/methylation domain-containing protein [Thermotogota bacterium]
FTLIEMMIVLAIIAALAATLTPIGISALNQARASKILSDLRAINMAAVSTYTMKGELAVNTGFPVFGAILEADGLEYPSGSAVEGINGYYTYHERTSGDDTYLEVTLTDFPENLLKGLADMVGQGDSFSQWIWDGAADSDPLYNVYYTGSGKPAE